MKLKLVALTIVGLMLGVSGCAGKPGDGPRESSTPTAEPPIGTSSSSTTATNPPPTLDEVPLDAFLSDCRRWNSAIVGPANVFGGSSPEGWERATASTLLMGFLECDRVSWGSFERGPVHVLMEFTEDSFAPLTCQQGDFDRYHILRSLWIDDETVASWIKATYGIPALVGDFAVADPGGLVETWTWSQPGGESSEMTFQDPPPTQNTPLTYIHRAFWFNETGVSYMDIREEYLNDDYSSPAAYGMLRPPMQYASMTGQTAFSGIVDYTPSADEAFSISRFGDLDCQKPV